MSIKARYVHTNIVAQDWQRLALFYESVFGCKPVPPERNLSGKWLEQGTGVSNAHINGIHMRLPDHGDKGPTLEIFQYNQIKDQGEKAINRPGFTHIAFAVENVEVAKRAVIEAGGKSVGDVVTLKIPRSGKVTFVYVTDPEGNIIELQHWSEV